MNAVGNIADISQIPEIEKAMANWAKDMPPDGEWRKRFQAEVALCLANIRRDSADVPHLLSFISQDDERRLLKPTLRLVREIATVSQIPEIEKAVAAWGKNQTNNGRDVGHEDRFEMELCLANIRRDPQDVPKLLSFMASDPKVPELSYHAIQVLGNIATVSQIPEIMQVIATLAEDEIPGVPYEKWPKEVRDRIEASFANIRERNVQWSPDTEKCSVP
jgi:hypothetical protein